MTTAAEITRLFRDLVERTADLPADQRVWTVSPKDVVASRTHCGFILPDGTIVGSDEEGTHLALIDAAMLDVGGDVEDVVWDLALVRTGTDGGLRGEVWAQYRQQNLTAAQQRTLEELRRRSAREVRPFNEDALSAPATRRSRRSRAR